MRKKSKPPNPCDLATVPFSSYQHADYLPIPFLPTMCILAHIYLPTYLLTYGPSSYVQYRHCNSVCPSPPCQRYHLSPIIGTHLRRTYVTLRGYEPKKRLGTDSATAPRANSSSCMHYSVPACLSQVQVQYRIYVQDYQHEFNMPLQVVKAYLPQD